MLPKMKISTTLTEFRYMQYICVCIVTLLNASLAMTANWLSPVLPQLTAEDAPLGVKFTDNEISWLVSSEKLGAAAGCVIAAFLSDKIGRKLVLLLAAVPIFLAFIISAFIMLPIVLILMRALSGFGTGFVFVVLHIYVGEVAEKDIRGRLGIVQSILNALGTIFVLSIGPFVSYKVLTLTCSAFPVIFMVLFFFMPETPYFLVKAGKIEAAKNSLHVLSAKDATFDFIESQLQEIQISIASDLSNKINLWELLKNESYRKPLMITLALRTVLVLSGVFVMNSYLQTIIESSGSSISPEISSIIFGVIQLPSVVVAALLVDRIGRRPLLIVSSLGCAVALIALGIYFYLQDYVHSDVTRISWLPTTSLSMYIILVYFGIFVLPAVAMAELYSIKMKSIASSFVSLYGALLGFLVAKFFQPLSNIWGVYTLFWIFAAVCIFGSLFGFFLLPETKGKSFMEIQAMLSTNKKLAKSVSGEDP